MPRYAFDIHDDGNLLTDEDGIVFANLEEAIEEAKRSLPAIAAHEVPLDGDRRNYTVVVKDEDGHAVYSAALSFVGTRLIP